MEFPAVLTLRAIYVLEQKQYQGISLAPAVKHA
jgi:hypothetical protein